MRSILHFSVVLFLALFMVACEEPTKSTTGSIEITLLDASENPLSGIKVILNPQLEYKYTDEAGFVAFTDIVAGEYTLQITVSSYADTVFSMIVEGGQTNSRTIKLVPNLASVEITVLNEEATPINGAVVTIASLELSETTDSEGIATFTDVRVGTYSFLITAYGYMDTTISIAVTGGVTNRTTVELIQTETVVSLVAYYPLDGNADDLSGNSLHGTVNGAVLTADRFSVDNMAYEFDGINDYIIVEDDPKLDITGGVTLSLWIKPTVQTSDGKTVIEKGGPGGWARYAFWCGTTTRAAFGIRTDSNPRIYSSSPLPVGEWTHMAGTYDQQYLRFYINGELVDEKEHTGAISVSNYGLYIGADAYADMVFFTGAIDEVRIYDGPLTAAEILALYNDSGGQRE